MVQAKIELYNKIYYITRFILLLTHFIRKYIDARKNAIIFFSSEITYFFAKIDSYEYFLYNFHNKRSHNVTSQ